MGEYPSLCVRNMHVVRAQCKHLAYELFLWYCCTAEPKKATLNAAPQGLNRSRLNHASIANNEHVLFAKDGDGASPCASCCMVP